MNACYCFPCRKFLASNDRDKVFTYTGFQNWKTGKGLNTHSSGISRIQAMSVWVERQAREKSSSLVELALS